MLSSQGKLLEVLKQEKVTCCDIEADMVGFGTENGYLYIIGAKDDVMCQFKSHDRQINAMSIDCTGTVVTR
jgi:hypothetical protein